MAKARSRISDKLMERIKKSKLAETKIYSLYEKYLSHEHSRIVANTLKTVIMNSTVVIFKFGMSIYYHSPWFAINAVFYLIICLAYLATLRKYAVVREVRNKQEQYNKEYAFYKNSGFFVIFLGIAYFTACMWMYIRGDAIIYSGEILNITVAFVAFCKITAAIIGVIRYKHMNNPLITSIKIIGLVDAVVSIVVAQCTLINMSGNRFSAIQSSAMFGMVCSIGFFIVGIVMILKKDTYKTRNGGSKSGAN